MFTVTYIRFISINLKTYLHIGIEGYSLIEISSLISRIVVTHGIFVTGKLLSQFDEESPILIVKV